MAAHGMSLRSGRILGLAAPPPPPPPPPPIPAGPPPPGLPAPNTFTGLPPMIRMAILNALFQGRPRMNLEDLRRPPDLGNLCLVNRQLKDEATEAFFRASQFEIKVLAAWDNVWALHVGVNWGQHPAVAPINPSLAEFRRRVARAQLLSPSRRSRSWGSNSVYRTLVSSPSFLFGATGTDRQTDRQPRRGRCHTRACDDGS